MNSHTEQFSASFFEAAPYLLTAQGQHTVLWLDADLPLERAPGLAEEISILHALGVSVSVVLDGYPDIRDTVSPDDAATAIATAHERLQQWMELLSRGWVGVPDRAYRLSVVTGNFLQVRRPGAANGIDTGNLGIVAGVDRDRVAELLKQGHVLLVTGSQTGGAGAALWVPPLDLASVYAIQSGAPKLVLVCEGLPLSDQPTELQPDQVRAVAADAEPRRARVLTAAADAADGGVGRVHIVNGKVHGALLTELLSRKGSGTLVTSLGAEQIVPATADELGELLALVSRFEPEGLLAARTRDTIEAGLDDFRLLKIDGRIAACAALRRFPDAGAALVESVAVHPEFQSEGLGTRLVKTLEREAASAGCPHVWAYTTNAEDWFRSLGYARSGVDVPAPVQQAGQPGRGSVLMSRIVNPGERTTT